MKNVANMDFADATFVTPADRSTSRILPRAWWVLPFSGLGVYVWYKIIAAMIALF